MTIPFETRTLDKKHIYSPFYINNNSSYILQNYALFLLFLLPLLLYPNKILNTTENTSKYN